MSLRLVALASSVALGAALLAGAPVVAGAAPAPATAPKASAAVADPDAKLTFFAGLPRDSKGLAAAGRKASTPRSGGYREFLTLRELATTYGASTAAIKKLRSRASDLGISVSVDATGLFARLTARVSTWERVMGSPVTYEPAQEGSAGADPPGAQPFATYEFLTADQSLLLAAPASLRGVVREFIPSYRVYDVTKDIPGVPPPTSTSASPRAIIDDTVLPWPTNGGTPLGQVCDQPAIAAGAVITPAQTRAAYGTTVLQGRGYDGSKARMTIVSLGGGFSTQDLADFAECFGVRAPEVEITLGTGNPTRIVSYSAETHLDLQTVAGVLVNSPRVQLVQAVNDAYNVGIIDGFSRALASPRGIPDAVSLSYGGCELGAAEKVQVGQSRLSPMMSVLDDVFASGAVVGSAFFTGSGDSGSSVCQMAGLVDLAKPTVALPASSIWITAAGGTRLTLGDGNRRIAETVWNDTAFGYPSGSGGGVSELIKAPWYQRGIHGNRGRTTPDSSALAAIQPGWPVAYGNALLNLGGTSGSSPFQASNIALISGFERAKGRAAVGFVNPWFYATPARNFHDVTEGDNQVPIQGPDFINAPACCSAYAGYDQASGLGAPLFGRLAAALPKPE
jgi:subtilase family serine protease